LSDLALARTSNSDATYSNNAAQSPRFAYIARFAQCAQLAWDAALVRIRKRRHSLSPRDDPGASPDLALAREGRADEQGIR
jgi:hypothetical protein